MVQARKINQEDFDTINSWCHHFDWPLLDLGRLQDTGVIIEDDNKPICVGFLLYLMNSHTAMIEAIISNPESTKESRAEALNCLIDKLISNGKETGIKNIITYCGHDSLISKFESFGFTVVEPHLMGLVRGI